jgi:hypothetical protein
MLIMTGRGWQRLGGDAWTASNEREWMPKFSGELTEWRERDEFDNWLREARSEIINNWDYGDS